MSGHSKWSKVKHQKAVTDVVKGKLFTKVIRSISTAISEGGGITDPDKNVRLRMALEEARDVNMPKDTISRAIERAKSQKGDNFEQVLYEGYGPYGVAILIEVATDNRNRTSSQIKNLLESVGGCLTSPGSVQHLFIRHTIIEGEIKENNTEDHMIEIALSAGCEEVKKCGNYAEFYTSVHDLPLVQDKLSEEGVNIIRTRYAVAAKSPHFLSHKEKGDIQHLIEELESIDDVQKVFTDTA